jgi:hypothetical protein
VSNPQPPEQQWDPLGQSGQDGWQPARPEPPVDQSEPPPQMVWVGQSQPGWDQPAAQQGWDQSTPQPGWDQPVAQPGWDQPVPQPAWSPSDPRYQVQEEPVWPVGAQPDSGGWPADAPADSGGWPADAPADSGGWPEPQPDAGAHRHYQAHARYTAVRVLAQLACLALIITGLSVKENGGRGWTDLTAWAIFAAAAAVVQMAPLVGRGFGLDAATSWTAGAVATAALVAYWVIIVLPSVSTNVGFALTMGTTAAVIGSWLSPGRQL